MSAIRHFLPSLSAPSEPKCNHSLRLFAVLSELCGKYHLPLAPLLFLHYYIPSGLLFLVQSNTDSANSSNSIPSNFNTRGSL